MQEKNQALDVILKVYPNFLDKNRKPNFLQAVKAFPKPSNIITRDENDPDYIRALKEVDQFLGSDPFKSLKP